jgi:hypothetical protein
MADLLHEYWESYDGGEFGLVTEHADRIRPKVFPNARFVFSLRASSRYEAMQLYQDKLGYGEYRSAHPNQFYTDDERAEQDAYLASRSR